jgi:hypothetical protein
MKSRMRAMRRVLVPADATGAGGGVADAAAAADPLAAGLADSDADDAADPEAEGATDALAAVLAVALGAADTVTLGVVAGVADAGTAVGAGVAADEHAVATNIVDTMIVTYRALTMPPSITSRRVLAAEAS